MPVIACFEYVVIFNEKRIEPYLFSLAYEYDPVEYPFCNLED